VLHLTLNWTAFDVALVDQLPERQVTADSFRAVALVPFQSAFQNRHRVDYESLAVKHRL
jgi:hypothetical protein